MRYLTAQNLRMIPSSRELAESVDSSTTTEWLSVGIAFISYLTLKAVIIYGVIYFAA